MIDIKDEKSKILKKIQDLGKNFQSDIKDRYAEDENFKNASEEVDNNSNDDLLLNIFAVFGINWKKLTGTYVEQIPNDKSIEEMRTELKKELEKVLKTFNDQVLISINSLVEDTVKKIEASDFMTEIVTNPCYSGKQASKELRKL